MSPPTQDPVWVSSPDLKLKLSPKLTTIDLIGGINCHICKLTFGNKKDFDGHYVNHNTGNAEIVYTCVVCLKQITGYPTFRGHCYNIHVSKQRFQCDFCDKRFSKTSVLKDHISLMHVYKCQSCNEQFPTKNELQIHQYAHKVENDKPPYNCRTCNKSLETADECDSHIEEHCTHSYTCPICNEAIATKEETGEHLKKHFGEVLNIADNLDPPNLPDDSSIFIVGIKCQYCDNSFNNRVEFDTHFSVNHGDKDIVYSCSICGKQYEKYSLFGSHCHNHAAKNRFECEICWKSFPRLSLLVHHTEAVHSQLDVFQCAQCPSRFTSGRRLREHLRTAHDAKNIKCSHPGCDTIVETPMELVVHMKRHGGGGDTWCRQCGLQFHSLEACLKHVPVHAKRAYHCPVCARAYAEKRLVLNHLHHHFHSVLHMCKMCGKIFSARHRFVAHLKTHSAQRAHVCQHCGKGFTKSNHLAQHVNVHTGLRPHACHLCPKTFAGSPNLAKHLRRVHNTTAKKSTPTPNDAKSAKDLDCSSSECPSVEASPSRHTSFKMESSSAEVSPSNNNMNVKMEYRIEQEAVCPGPLQRDSQIFDEDISSMHTDSDSVDFPDVLPDNSPVFVSGGLEYSSETSASTVSESWSGLGLGCPPEYGPDFINKAAGLSPRGGDVIDLDDHILPHIDPLLTIKPAAAPPMFAYDPPPAYEPKWEPPVITKLYPDYSYGYDLNLPNRGLAVLNTDIF